MTTPLMELGSYDLLVPRQIVFGWGRRAELPRLVKNWGTQSWIVAGSRTLISTGIVDQLRASLQVVGIRSEVLCVQNTEPTVTDIDTVTKDLRNKIDKAGSVSGHWILAIGGGSAIDLGKAIAALIPNANGASVTEYLEGLGSGRELTNPSLPVAALPTTSGTGSESTKNAVVSSIKPAAKKSLRSPWMIPTLALIDPELTVSVSAKVTTWTGLDALTQLIESYITRRATPVTRALALEGLRGLIPALRIATQDGNNRAARERLAQSALLSGIALANSGLGMAHGVAAALGAIYNVPHGLACAVMLPTALRVNRECCEADYTTLASVICEQTFHNSKQAAESLMQTIQTLCNDFGIPNRLSSLGVQRNQLPELVVGSHGNSMNGNPRNLTDEELQHLLETLL